MFRRKFATLSSCLACVALSHCSCSTDSDTLPQSDVMLQTKESFMATGRPSAYPPTKDVPVENDLQFMTHSTSVAEVDTEPWVTSTWNLDLTETHSPNTEPHTARDGSEDEPTIPPTTTKTAPLTGARQEENFSTETLTTLRGEDRGLETTEVLTEKEDISSSEEWQLQPTPSLRVVRSVASLAVHVQPTPTSEHHHFLVTANSDVASGVAMSEPPVPAPVSSHSRKSDRKSKPDIQDIIDGIVKLLGGKVHVQAATEPLLSKDPVRPGNSRINNRGPPRITELPFEAVPIEAVSRRPSPPFGIPFPMHGRPLHNSNTAQPPFQNGIPLPEQVVPPFIGGRPRPRPPLLRPQPTQPTPLLIPLRPPFHPQGADAEEKEHAVVVHMNPAEVNQALSKVPEGTDGKVKTAAPSLPIPLPPSFNSSDASELPPHPELSLSLSLAASVVTLSRDTSPVVSSSPVLVVPTATLSPVVTVKETASTSTASSPSPVPVVTSSKEVYIQEDSPPLLEPSVTEVMTTSEAVSSVTVMPTPVLGFESSHVPNFLRPVFSPSLTSSAATMRPLSPLVQPEIQVKVQPTRPMLRPGIVIDDTAYRPADVIVGEVVHGGGIPGEIFDITVTANQNFGGRQREPTGKPYVIPVDIEDILTTATGTEQFVSIDGKRTYFNLFPTGTGGSDSTQVVGAGINFGPPKPPVLAPPQRPPSSRPSLTPPLPRPPSSRPTPSRRPFRRPSLPPVRIDTCIVGDASTCESEGHEVCRTEQGVSACVCRPGFARRRHRGPCTRAVSLLISLKVDRMNEQRIAWDNRYRDSSSEQYQELEWEAGHALDSAMGMTPMATLYMGSHINAFYAVGGRVMVNATMLLQQTQQTRAPAVKRSIQRHLLQVIQRRGNNIGESALWVEGPLNPIPGLQDVNECTNSDLNDCDPHSTCTNIFGSFRCTCAPGYRDRHSGDDERSGRRCESCSQDYCSGRGQCSIEGGQRVCHCHGNFYGAQCEVDGEVLGVAVGASVTAVVIIVLTLICLCMWSRRWKREQQKTELLSGRTGVSPATYNYVSKGQGSTYHVTLEDRLRWAQIVDAVSAPSAPAQNVYAPPGQTASEVIKPPGRLLQHGSMQPDPMGATATRPSSALLGGVPLFRMFRTPVPFGESNDENDDDDGIRGQKARSKSRASIANQSGIYYDLEYEDAGETMGRGPYGHQMPIPLSTYMPAMGRPFYG